jgi:nicotinamidase-related amidase
MRIKASDSVGLIIDVQSRLFPFIFENEKLADNIVKLVNGLKVLGIDIIVTEQYSKGLGNTIEPILSSLEEYKYFEKMSFSCCGFDDFNNEIKLKNKKNIIIAGIESHVCVLQTVLDLIQMDYQPVVIEDCISSRRINDKNIAVRRMRKEGAIISTYESILFELLEVSGTEQFKAISKIVK